MSNSDVARRYFDAISAGKADEALDQFAPNAKFLTPMGELPFPDGARVYLAGYDASFKGHGFRISRVIESGDEVAVEGVWHGTHSGPLALPDGSQLPPTRKTVEAPFVTMLTMHEGKI